MSATENDAQQRSLPTRPCPGPQAPHHGPHEWRDAGDTFHCDGDKSPAQQRSVVADAKNVLADHDESDWSPRSVRLAREVLRQAERLAAVEALCEGWKRLAAQDEDDPRRAELAVHFADRLDAALRGTS